MNYYAEAISILAKDNVDWKGLVFTIAQRHPKVVVDAIKCCQAETGVGLIEAKLAVEEFMREDNLDQE